MKATRFIRRTVLCVIAAWAVVAGAEPVRLILDTDMSGDCDDAGALAVVHALADRGECDLLAVLTNGRDLTRASAAAVDAINTARGRPDIPIGVDKVGGVLLAVRSSYTEALRDRFPGDVGGDADAPAAVALCRRVLAGQPDGSVVICSIGALTNVAAVWQADPELVRAKVRLLVAMAGQFPASTKPEWNVRLHPLAAKLVADEWPTDLVWHGFEVGERIITGAGLAATPADNPVRVAYELKPYGTRPAIAGGQPSWDQAAVLYAVRGPGPDRFEVVREGRVAVDEAGNTSWRTEAGGRHAHVRIAGSAAAVAATIEALMVAAPGRRGTD